MPFNSRDYWIQRYSLGGNSGAGSRGVLADYKQMVLNAFIYDHGIKTVIDFGCGDGFVSDMLIVDGYTGYDVVPMLVDHLSERNPHRQYYLMEDYDGRRADATLSLDVIFHLIEEQVYQEYMHRLFKASDQWVVIYSSDYESAPTAPHDRRRRFTRWIDANTEGWEHHATIANLYPEMSASDFYIYKRGQ